MRLIITIFLFSTLTCQAQTLSESDFIKQLDKIANAQVANARIPSIAVGIVKDGKVFLAKDIYNNKSWYMDAVNLMTENVFITIDLDVFDPSIMPSTGTPEPGGLDWYNVIDFVKKVFEKKNVVGFDIVELCPNPNNKAPDFLAAKLYYKMLSYKFSSF